MNICQKFHHLCKNVIILGNSLEKMVEIFLTDLLPVFQCVFWKEPNKSISSLLVHQFFRLRQSFRVFCEFLVHFYFQYIFHYFMSQKLVQVNKRKKIHTYSKRVNAREWGPSIFVFGHEFRFVGTRLKICQGLFSSELISSSIIDTRTERFPCRITLRTIFQLRWKKSFNN